ncbi:MAG: cytochrome b [Sphingopyxis sp.]
MDDAIYTRGARWLHWAMAVLIIGNLVGGLAHDVDPKLIMPLHKSAGFLLLALALVRVAWRFTHRPPALPGTMAGWEKLASHATHITLYAMMVLIPLSGWIMSSPSPYPLDFFGLFPIMKFDVAKDSALAGIAHEGHELLAFAMIGLLLLHIGAALRHHFIIKDNVLRRMVG